MGIVSNRSVQLLPISEWKLPLQATDLPEYG